MAEQVDHRSSLMYGPPPDLANMNAAKREVLHQHQTRFIRCLIQGGVGDVSVNPQHVEAGAHRLLNY